MTENLSQLPKYFKLVKNTTNLLSRSNKMIKGDSLQGLIKDNKISFMKSQMKDHFTTLINLFPVEGITYDQYLSDLRITAQDSSMMKLISETDQYFSFEFGNLKLIDKDNISIPSIKTFLANYNPPTKLRIHNLSELYIDMDSRVPKIVDISVLWYTDITDESRHMNLLPLRIDDTNWKVYQFGDATDDMKTCLSVMEADAAKIGITYTIEVV